MKINRRQLRKMILREFRDTHGSFTGYNPRENLKDFAAAIESGYIIDLSAMEGSGGGYYPLYEVSNGRLRMINEHIGADLAHEIVDAEGDYKGYIFDYVEKYVGDVDPEEFGPYGGIVDAYSLQKTKIYKFPKADMNM